MRTHQRPGRSGHHSISDARQHAFSLLLFGPGAPAPRQRPHRGQLSDLPEPVFSSRPSVFARFVRLFRGAVPDAPAERKREKGEEPDLSAGAHEDAPAKTSDRLAA